MRRVGRKSRGLSNGWRMSASELFRWMQFGRQREVRDGPKADVRAKYPNLIMMTASLTSATSPSAIWIETSGAQRDELHRWPAILFRPSGRSVPKTDRSPLPKSRYSSFAPSIGVTWASKAKRLSRFWVSSLCTPSARSDTSLYLSRLRTSCGPGPCPRGPAHR